MLIHSTEFIGLHGHSVNNGAFLILSQGKSSFFVHGKKSVCPVFSHTGQDDADGIVPATFGYGGKEVIN